MIVYKELLRSLDLNRKTQPDHTRTKSNKTLFLPIVHSPFTMTNLNIDRNTLNVLIEKGVFMTGCTGCSGDDSICIDAILVNGETVNDEDWCHCGEGRYGANCEFLLSTNQNFLDTFSSGATAAIMIACLTVGILLGGLLVRRLFPVKPSTVLYTTKDKKTQILKKALDKTLSKSQGSLTFNGNDSPQSLRKKLLEIRSEPNSRSTSRRPSGQEERGSSPLANDGVSSCVNIV